MANTAEADHYYSREAFLRWAESQPRGRYERVDGRIVAMAPERGAHLRMKAAIWLALKQALAASGVDGQALPDGATVAAGDNDYEPDALVNCGKPMDDNAIVAPQPVVVVEVLSTGTRGTDTGGKLAGYFTVASVHHYLIVHPVQRLVVHHRRKQGQEGSLDTRILTAGDIVLDPPGITVSIEALYSNL